MKKRTPKLGFTLRIHPAGAAALAIAVLLLDSRQVLSAFLALFLHEGAHLLVMRLCGVRNCTVEITPFGGMADARSFEHQSAAKRMLCVFAGVAGSALTAGMTLLYAPRTAFWQLFFQSNLMLAAINSLPAWPLDGARIIAACAAKFGFESTARRILSYVTLLLGAGMVALGLYGIWLGTVNVSLLMTGPYLWYAARVEDVSAKVRRLHDAADKISCAHAMPALVWVGSTETDEKNFAVLLGRMERDKYHLFVQVDPKNGKIHRVWTENEMLTITLDGLPEMNS